MYRQGFRNESLSQQMDIVFKVYHAQETKKLKQATVFLETMWGNQKERQGLKGKGKDPLGANQCAFRREEGHWKKDYPEFKKKNKKEGPDWCGLVGWASSCKAKGPGQGTCLGCRFGLLVRAHRRNNRSMFLSLSFSLPPPFSKNKQNLKKKKEKIKRIETIAKKC